MTRPPKPEPPADLRISELKIDDVELLVLSYAIEPPDLAAQFGLTAAEVEVAGLAIAGLSTAALAKRRGAAVRTVANQIAAVLRKVGVASRRELAARHARGASER
ncbi:MAG TPA: helix-turn-helix transcriptional regulator [Nannocystaceae bacterium]|nr:helix-turn-helix transcriptional regulator [Nannocystaceae bacterium]